MPMNWDLTETELAKNKDKDKWHKGAWKFIFSNLNPDKPHKDKEGHTWHPIEYDLVYLLMRWIYAKKGGNYGDRGAEMLRGTYFVFEKTDIPKFKKEAFKKTTKQFDQVLEKLVGMKVWATIKC